MLNLQEGFIPPPQELYRTLTNNVDYFKGHWKSCSIFSKNLVNMDVLFHNFDYWFDVIKTLRELQCVGLALEWAEGGLEVYPHVDSDLIGDVPSTRIWYPLQNDYFEFIGTVVKDGRMEYQKLWTNEPVIFSPHLEHSFRSEKTGYYFIIDFVKDVDDLKPEFWQNYLGFIVKNYTSFEGTLNVKK